MTLSKSMREMNGLGNWQTQRSRTPVVRFTIYHTMVFTARRRRARLWESSLTQPASTKEFRWTPFCIKVRVLLEICLESCFDFEKSRLPLPETFPRCSCRFSYAKEILKSTDSCGGAWTLHKSRRFTLSFVSPLATNHPRIWRVSSC